MNIYRGLHRLPPGGRALTIGNFDGVHRGHQAMLALLNSEARHRGVPSCVMTFEPHPRDYFAAVHHKPELAPARIATLRDKLRELERCGVDECVVLPFNARLASQTAAVTSRASLTMNQRTRLKVMASASVRLCRHRGRRKRLGRERRQLRGGVFDGEAVARLGEPGCSGARRLAR